MNGMTRYQIRKHPVIAFVMFLLFGPYLLAAALLIGLAYGLVFILALAFTK